MRIGPLHPAKVTFDPDLASYWYPLAAAPPTLDAA